jgi:hypothetical protein
MKEEWSADLERGREIERVVKFRVDKKRKRGMKEEER